MSTIASLIIGMSVNPAGVKSGLASARSDINSFSRDLKGLAVAFAAYKVGGFIKDSIDLAARYQTLGVVMNVVGNNAGKTGAEMKVLQESLETTGISMIQSRLNLIRLAQSHVDLAKATALGRVAQDAAVIANINSSEAFETLVHGIQSGQVRVLRNIGIMVSFKKAYKDAEAQLHKTKDAMTETELANARANAVMKAGEIIAGTYTAAQFTAGKQLRSTERYLENVRVKAASAFLPAYTKLVFDYANALKFLGDHVPAVTATIYGLAGALGVLAAVASTGAIVKLIAFLATSEVAIPIAIAMTAIGTIMAKLGYDAAKAADKTTEFANALQALGNVELERRLKNLNLNAGDIIDNAVSSGKGLSKEDQAQLDRIRARKQEIQAALAENKIAAGVKPEEPPSALETERKGALERLKELRLATPGIVEGFNKIAEMYRNGDAVAAEFAKHQQDVNEKVVTARKGLLGTNRALAENAIRAQEAAKYNADLAEKVNAAAESARVAIRDAKQANDAYLLVGSGVRYAAIQQKYFNDVADASKNNAPEVAAALIAGYERVYAAQKKGLVTEDTLAPMKAAVEGMTDAFGSFFSDLVTNSRSAFQNLLGNAKSLAGSLVGTFAKRVFEVQVLPKLAKAFGLVASIAPLQLAAQTNATAAQTMVGAAVAMQNAANTMVGSAVRLSVPGNPAGGPAAVAPSLGSKLLGGAGIAFAGFSVGQLAGGLTSNKLGSSILGAASGAATGALIGSIIPGIGTVIGAAIGGVAGLIGGWLGSKKKTPPAIDTLIKGLEFDSTKIQSLSEIQDRIAKDRKKLAGTLDLEKRIELEDELKRLTDAVKGTTAAFSDFNVPTIFKSALAYFDSRNPDFAGTGSVPSGGGSSGGGGGGGGNDSPEVDGRGESHQYNIQVVATDRSMTEVFDEIEAESRRRSLARYGSSAGVGILSRPVGAF